MTPHGVVCNAIWGKRGFFCHMSLGFVDVLIPPTFPVKGPVLFEPVATGASRGLTAFWKL